MRTSNKVLLFSMGANVLMGNFIPDDLSTKEMIIISIINYSACVLIGIALFSKRKEENK